jgi:hypothetical protein
LLPVFISYSQETTKNATLTLSPVLKDKRINLLTVITQNNEGYFITVLRKNKLFLEQIDYNLNIVKSINLSDKEESDITITHYDDFFINGNIYIFKKYKNKNLQTIDLYAEKINPQTFVRSEKAIKIFSMPYNKGLFNNIPEIKTIVSPNNSKLLIYNDIKEDKKENETFNLNLFDENLQKIGEKKLEIPYRSDLFVIKEIRVDDFGNVYFTCLEYLDKEAKAESKTKFKYRYRILCYMKERDELKDYVLNLDNKFITVAKIAIDKKGDIIVTGFYSEKNRYAIKGTFYQLINTNTNELKVSNYNEFKFNTPYKEESPKNSKENSKKNKKNNNNNELYDYYLDEIKLKDDGSITLIAEKCYYRIIRYTTTNPNTGSTTYKERTEYLYLDIYVVHIGIDGNIKWSTFIPKRQIVNDLGKRYASYICTEFNNKLYFIFNDHPDNIKNGGKAPLKNMGVGKFTAAALVTIDENGNKTRELLYNQKKRNPILQPSSSFVKNGEFMLYGDFINKYQFVRVVLK